MFVLNPVQNIFTHTVVVSYILFKVYRYMVYRLWCYLVTCHNQSCLLWFAGSAVLLYHFLYLVTSDRQSIQLSYITPYCTKNQQIVDGYSNGGLNIGPLTKW